MALPTDNRPIGNIISMTLDAYFAEIVDDFFNTNALFLKLYNRAGTGGSTIVYDGGAEIRSTIIYGNVPTGSYGQGQTFPTNPTEFATQLQMQWKRLFASINADALDIAKNKGREVQLFDYLGVLAKNAFNSLADEMGYQIFGTVADPSTGVVGIRTIGPNDMDGLYNGVLDTGTYGGITRSSTYKTPGYAIRSPVFNAGTAPLSLSLMQSAYGAATIMPAQPDLIVMTQNKWNQLWELVQPQDRNPPGPLRDVGFDTIRFNKAECIVDSHNLDSNIYFLNTEFIQLWVMEGKDFRRRSQMDGLSAGYPIPNQDSYVDQLIIYTDLVIPGPRYQSVLTNLGA